VAGQETSPDKDSSTCSECVTEMVITRITPILFGGHSTISRSRARRAVLRKHSGSSEVDILSLHSLVGMRYATCDGWQVCQSRSFDRGYRTPGDTTMLKLNFDFIRDIVPVASIVRVPLVMEVHPSVPTKTVAEFIAYAQGQSRQDQYSVSGNRIFAPRGRRNVQDDGRPRSVSRASRSTGVSGSARRTGAGIFWSPSVIDRVCQGRQTTRLGRNHHDAVGRRRYRL
jgi:hypothetical protein